MNFVLHPAKRGPPYGSTPVTDFRPDDFRPELMHFARILESGIETFKALLEDDIQSSGFVVHTLKAALYCLLNARFYMKSVLKSENLEDDTDTTAAVTGGLAGIHYGYDSLKLWVSVIEKRRKIEVLALGFTGVWQ